MKLTFTQYKIAVLLLLLPTFVLAHGLTTEIVLIGWSIFFLPIVIGMIVAGKGKRFRFFIVSLVVYTLSFAVMYLFIEHAGLLLLFLPWLLVPVAVMARMGKI